MGVAPNFDLGIAGEDIAKSRQRFVGEILKKRAYLTPDREALQWDNRIWSYAELHREVNILANNLMSLGVERGERIAFISHNRSECAHVLYAAARIGAIVAFQNWRYTDAELCEALDLITAETVVVSHDFVERLQGAIAKTPYVKRVVLLDEAAEFSSAIQTVQFAELVAQGDESEPEVELNEEDALYIVYTSGTTGKPKGAVISQRAEIQRTIAFATTYPALIGVNGDDSCIARGPFFHVTSVHELFSTHWLGGKVIIMAGYDVSRLVDHLEKESLGWLSLSPGMYERLVEEIKRRGTGVRKVKAIGSIPDVTPIEQITELTATTGAPFMNTYGLTEISMENFTTTVLPVSGPGVSYENMGKGESFFCEMKLLDAQGNPVPDGQPGELVLRTPMMFSGYWNNPEANARAFRGGWYHTGDVLSRNSDGTLEFVSRTKYLIKSGGENIYPAEIERVLLSHEQVREACVVSARHPKWGETPVAFVAANGDLDEASLLAYCRDNLARYRVPNVIDFVNIDDFPRNLTGKILREQVELWLDRVSHRII